MITANTWYHVAVSRQGTALRMFVNGALVGSSSNTANMSSSGALFIGRINATYPAYDWDGYIDELRITKGLARYTSAFTPPATPFGNGTTATPAVPSLIDTSVPLRTWNYTYNQYGQMLTAKDPLNNTTTYAYYPDTTFTGTDPNAVGHTLGDLQTVTNAAGKVTSYTKYNKLGQVLEMRDPNGVLTVSTYDPRQRLLSRSIGGQTTSYAYDPAGQLLKITAPDSSWVGYEYDAAHRLVATKDNLGNRIEYTLSNAGERIAENVKDPSGTLARTLIRSIDALGRVQQTTGRE